jgi:hypothetical protein
MPQAMTFASLKTDVQNYLERGSSVATDPIVYEQIPKLINLAERRIARDLKLQGFQTVVTTAMQANVCVMPKPDRWRETISINIGIGTGNNSRKTLFTRSYEYCRTYWPDQTVTGTPEFYADYDYTHWLFAGTPDQAYPIEIVYYELPPLLDDAFQQNWLTSYAPNALLYGTLLEATPFLKNDERIPVWQQFYQMSVDSLNTEDIKKITDRSTTRTEA